MNGRLQVTPDSVTLEVIGEDLDGRRRICSVPLSDDKASNLRQRWDDKGENDIITLYDGFLPIASQETMAQIADEIEEAAKRGLSVRCVLFPEKTSPSIGSHWRRLHLKRSPLNARKGLGYTLLTGCVMRRTLRNTLL